MAESMVETLARAVFDAHGWYAVQETHEYLKPTTVTRTKMEWENFGAQHKLCRAIARAVLEALKTPTEGMKQAGAGEILWYDRSWDSAEDFFENAFEAAIQAALNEGEGK